MQRLSKNVIFAAPMSRSLPLLLIGSLLLSATSRAQIPVAGDPSDASPVADFCHALILEKPPRTRVFPMVKEVFRAMVSPLSYAAPVTAGTLLGENEPAADEAELPGDSGDGDSRPDDSPVENVIFSFAPIEAHRDPKLLSAHLQERKDIQKRMNPLFKYHRKLSHLKTVEECVARVQADHYDPEQFQKLLKRRSELIDAEFATQQKPLARSIRKTLKKLKLRWKLIEVTELDQVKAALSDPRTRNIVLLHHGMDTGQIIDSARNGYPKSLFEGVTPGLQSLSLFSCHAQKARELYALDRALALATTPGRLLFTARESRFLGRDGVVPMGVFHNFLREIDRKLFSSRPPAVPAHPAPSPCTLRLSGISAVDSDFGLFVGGRYAGSLKRGATEAVIPVACKALANGARGAPDVRLATLSIHDRSDLKLEKARIEAEDGRSWSLCDVFPREDGTLSSVTFIQNR
jgi:hypothetical protein